MPTDEYSKRFGHIPKATFTPRMVERSGRIASVVAADFAAADHVDELAVESGDDDAIVIAVGDEQSLAGAVGQHLTRKT